MALWGPGLFLTIFFFVLRGGLAFHGAEQLLILCWGDTSSRNWKPNVRTIQPSCMT